MTFTLQDQTSVGKVIGSIREVDQLINSVIHADVYRQNHTFTITYLDPKSNLSSEKIAPVRKKIVKALTAKYKAGLVGKV